MGRSPAVTKDARERNFVTIIFAFFPTGCKYGLEKLTGIEFKISDFCGKKIIFGFVNINVILVIVEYPSKVLFLFYPRNEIPLKG